MEDDVPPPEKSYPVSTAKMSKTPSWIMLGFLLGAAFVAALPPLRKVRPPEPAELRPIELVKASGPREAAPFSTIEAVFAEWGRLAVWHDDLTEVALWSGKENAFADFYEVRRSGGVTYFRTITQLTRRLITRGKPIPECPLQFTETEEQYQEYVQHGRNVQPAERSLKPLVPIVRAEPAVPRMENPATKIPPPVLERILPALEATPPARDAKDDKK